MNWYSHTEVVHIAGKNSVCTSANHFVTVWQDPRQHPPNQTALNFWMKFWLERSTDISEQQHLWKAGQGMAHKAVHLKGAEVLAKPRPFQKMVTFQAMLRRCWFFSKGLISSSQTVVNRMALKRGIYCRRVIGPFPHLYPGVVKSDGGSALTTLLAPAKGGGRTHCPHPSQGCNSCSQKLPGAIQLVSYWAT